MKHLQAFFNKVEKKTTVSMETISYIKDGLYYLTDLTTYLVVNADGYEDGTYIIANNELLRTGNLKEGELLELPKGNWDIEPFQLSYADQIKLMHVAKSAANDDLRPNMSCVNFDTDVMVAVNGHLLRQEKLSTPSTSQFLMPIGEMALFKNLVNRNKEACTVVMANYGDAPLYKYVKFWWADTNDTCYMRLVDATFPDYKSILPNESDITTHYTVSAQTVVSQAKSIKAINKETPRAFFKEKAIVCNNVDTNVKKTFPLWKETTSPKTSGLVNLIMPVMANDESVKFGIDFGMLANLIYGYQGDITIGVRNDSLAIVVWMPEETPKRTFKSMVKKLTSKPKAEPTPEPKATTDKPTPQAEAQPDKPKTKSNRDNIPNTFVLIDYSDRAVALFGPTKKVKDKLKELHGSYSPYLKYKGEPTPGWVFSKKRKKEVEQLIAS